MKSIKSRRSLLALGTASFALLPLASAVQAQPRYTDYPPASDSRYDDRDDVRYNNYGRLVTLEAVVISRRDNDEFRVRAGSEEFDVHSNDNEIVRTGDRITLRGSFDDRHDFNASNVDFVGNGRDLPGDDNRYGDDYRAGRDGRIDFPAVVLRVIDSDEMMVRGDNGRTYRVKTRSNLPKLHPDDRLRVQGFFNGTSIYRANLVDIRKSDNGYGYGIDRKVDFPGRIIHLDRSRNEATVRGENGRDYLVRGREVDDFSTDQRVRVCGYARGGYVDLTSLDRIR